MLQRFRKDEQGFTLIELLVVILIIGILAAIALPTFLGQQDKAKDASTKSDVRNAVTQVESCYATEQNYANCVTGSTGLTGVASGVTVATATGGYTVSEASSATSGGGTYTITKNNQTYTRTCSNHGSGGCKSTADSAGNYW